MKRRFNRLGIRLKTTKILTKLCQMRGSFYDKTAQKRH